MSSVFGVTNTKVKKDNPLINQGQYLVPQEKAPSMSDPNTGIKNSFNLTARNNINAPPQFDSPQGFSLF